MVHAHSTPKTYVPVTGLSSSSLCSDQRQPASSTTHSATVTLPTAPAAAPGRYDFIRDPAKKAFFESSPPSSPAAAAVATYSREPSPGVQTDAVVSRQQTMSDRSDIDINMEAKINQYVQTPPPHTRTHTHTHAHTHTHTHAHTHTSFHYF